MSIFQQTAWLLQVDMISLESRTSQKNNNPADISRLPKFIASFMDNVYSIFKEVDFDASSTVIDSEITNIISNHKYTAMTGIEIYKPTGLNVSFVEYVAVLETWHKSLIDIETRLLQPLTQWTAQLLGDPARLLHVSTLDKFKRSDVDGLNESLGNTTDSKDTSTVGIYKDLIKRNADWNTITTSIKDMNLEYAKNSPSSVFKAIEELVSNLNLLLKRIEDNPSVYKVSGSSLNTLVNIVHHVGVEAELYGVHGYNLTAMNQMLIDNAERLSDIYQ